MNINLNLLLLWFALLAHCGLVAQNGLSLFVKHQPYQIPENAEYLDGRIILKIKKNYRDRCKNNDISIPGIQQKIGTLKGEGLEKLFPKINPPATETDPYGRRLVDVSTIYSLKFTANISIQEAVNYLLQDEAIEYAEPWYIHRPFYLPNDPISDTTGFLVGSWHHEQIKALDAWDIQRGDASVLIAVVDAGFKLEHPDLQDNLRINLNDPVDGIDNDQDGYVDNDRGWDFGGDNFGGSGDNNPSVGNVHGHWVLGTFAATADNNLGTTGTAFNCSYLPIKAAPNDSLGIIFFGYQGIVYAATHDADVINASWGGPVESLFGRDAIRFATINHRAAVIASAGNSGLNQIFYPAGYEEVISVAGSFYGDTVCCQLPNPAGNSTFHHSVDISAPGWAIRSPFADNGYWSWNGTSAAAPVVAAVVGITKTRFPYLTGFQAAQKVRVNTDGVIYDINPSLKDFLGTGRVDMLSSISDSVLPSVRYLDFQLIGKNGDSRLEAGDTVILSIDFMNYLHPTQSLGIELTSSLPLATMLNNDFQAGAVATMQKFSSQNTFEFKLSEFTPTDFNLELKLTYTDPATGYSDFEYINVRVNRSWLNIEDNKFHTTVNSSGSFGFNDFATNHQGLGVQYNFNPNSLFEGGFLIGNSSSMVSDRIRNTSSRDNDFRILEKVSVDKEDNRTPFVYKSKFDDSVATSPLGVSLSQSIFASRDPAYDDFVIFQYIIKNNNATPLSNLYAGLFADWDINPGPDPVTGVIGTKNAANYDEDGRLAFSWDLAGNKSEYYGINVLSDQNFHSFVTTNPSSTFSFDNPGKYLALSNNPTPGTASAGTDDGGADVLQFVSAGPFSIPAGGVDTVAFAVLGGPAFSNLQISAASAQNLYYCVIEGNGPVEPFLASTLTVAPGQSVQFSDQNPQANTWSWDFGDGFTDDKASPSHTYSQEGIYTVYLTVSDGTCTYRSEQKITVTNSVKIQDLLPKGNLRLYPNPGGGILHLELEDNFTGKYSIEILDIQGKIITQHQGVKTALLLQETLDFSYTSSGIYFLRFISQGPSFTQKIIRE